MNIEAYDTESLRKLVRLLEYENRILKEKLKRENIPYEEIHPFEEMMDDAEAYDPDQGGRIFIPRLLQRRWQNAFFLCFGEGKMSMRNGAGMAVIFLNVITDGTTSFVQNSREKRCFVMNVRITNGQGWM